MSFNLTLPADILQLHLVFHSHHTGMLHRWKKKTICILSFQDTSQEINKQTHHPESAILSHSATRWILLCKVQNSGWVLTQREKKKESKNNEDFCVCVIHWCALKCSNLCLTKAVMSMDFLRNIQTIDAKQCFPAWLAPSVLWCYFGTSPTLHTKYKWIKYCRN